MTFIDSISSFDKTTRCPSDVRNTTTRVLLHDNAADRSAAFGDDDGAFVTFANLGIGVDDVQQEMLHIVGS